MTLVWILGSGAVMALLSLVGGFTLLMSGEALRRLLLPLVAIAGGSLIGAALFHMVPASLAALPSRAVWPLVVCGFAAFLGLEQLLHWHHGHRPAHGAKPVTYLVLIGDSVHNFLDGVTIAGAFLIDFRLGAAATIAAAAHELPQELGDFGVLVHGGWSAKRALLFNALSSLTFFAGGILTYLLSFALDVSWVVPFAAGTFLYIGATDLVPELNKPSTFASSALLFSCFAIGAGAMYAAATLE